MTSFQEMTFSELLSDAEVFVDGDWVESKDQDQNGDVRLIQLADIGDGFYIDKSSRFLNSETAKRLKCTYLKEGDILVARMPDPLGRACIFPKSEMPCVTVVDVCIIRPNQHKVDNRWLMHTINSPVMRQRINEYVTGTTRQRISRGNFSKLKISVPPLAEQRRIASILDQADELRQKRQQAIEKLDQLLQATFIDMFGDPVSNPKGWERVSVKNVLKIQGGFAFSSNDFSKSGIPVVKIGNANKLGFSTEKFDFIIPQYPEKLTQYELRSGDLLMSLTGTVGKDDYGNITEVTDDYDLYYLNQRVAKLEVINTLFSKNYIRYFFSQSSIKALITKNNRGVRQANISNSDLYELDIPLPTKAQLDKFDSFIESINETKRYSKVQLISSNKLFFALQNQAFNGTL